MDELVRRLWECASGECFNCSQYTPTTNASVCQKELMKQAADAIEELQARLMYSNDAAKAIAEKVPKWIPVSEWLPDFEGAVLCMRKSIVCGVRPYQEILYVDEFGFKNFDDIYLADGVVTHWMPLPEPPGATGINVGSKTCVDCQRDCQMIGLNMQACTAYEPPKES